MIELLTEQSVVLTFAHLDDEVEEKLNMSKSAWIQWLMSSMDNDKIRVWINTENEVINGYVAAINNISPPIADTVLIYYIWVENKNKYVDGYYSQESLIMVDELLKNVKDWSLQIGASSVVGTTTVPSVVFEMFGFKEVSRFVEWRV